MLFWSLLYLKSINSGFIYLFWKFACHLQVQRKFSRQDRWRPFQKINKINSFRVQSKKLYLPNKEAP